MQPPTTATPRRSRSRLLLLLALICAAAWIAPGLVRLNFWHQQVVDSLSRVLRRPVKVGTIHPKIWGGPGLEIENVSVAEDPRFGIEPLVRMESLQADIAFRSLWKGALEFSSITFIRPSLNLVRNGTGEWNLMEMARSGGKDTSAAGRPGPDWPTLRAESGRINFKDGDVKRSWIMDGVDFSLVPPSSAAGAWELSLQATPNRVDAPIPSASRFEFHGQLGPLASDLEQETGIPLVADWSASGTLLSDLTLIATGSDAGIHGVADLRGHLSGTTSLLRWSVKATLRDLHRWDLLPPSRAFPLDLEASGIADFGRGSVQIASLSVPVRDGEITVEGRVDSIGDAPVALLHAGLREVPLSELTRLGPQFFEHWNTRLQFAGRINGELQTRGSAKMWNGTLELSELEVHDVEDTSDHRLRANRIVIALDTQNARMAPVVIRLYQQMTSSQLMAAGTADLSGRTAVLRLNGRSVPFGAFSYWARKLVPVLPEPTTEAGRADLSLNIALDAVQPTQYRGSLQLRDSEFAIPGANTPLHIAAAKVRLDSDKIAIAPLSAWLGGIQLEGAVEVRRSPASLAESAGASRQIEFQLHTPLINVGELRRIFTPAPRNFPWSYFEPRPALPLSTLVARGTIDAAELRIGDYGVQQVHATLDARRGRVAIPELTAALGSGGGELRALVDLAAEPPSIAAEMRVDSVDVASLSNASSAWRGLFSGTLSGDIRVQSSGSGWDEILSRLSGTARLKAPVLTLHGVDLYPRPILHAAMLNAPAQAAGRESPPYPSTIFYSLQSVLRISGERISIQSMRWSPEPVQVARGAAGGMSMKGTIRFGREIDLTVSRDAEAQQVHWGGTLNAPIRLPSVAADVPQRGASIVRP